jgi:hypothetical protein
MEAALDAHPPARTTIVAERKSSASELAMEL